MVYSNNEIFLCLGEKKDSCLRMNEHYAKKKITLA